MDDIRKRLFELQDTDYKTFMERLVPNVPKDTIIGVRLPILRKLAGEMIKEGTVEEFLKEVPHQYFEENHLHSFLVDKTFKTFEQALLRTEEFLPYIDNWAVCDSFRPKSLKKNMSALYHRLEEWMESEKTYTIRLSLVLQLNWFLEEYFQPEMLGKVSKIQSNDYHVNMAVSWYYSMALVKQYDATIPMFQERVLPIWVHNRSLQKAMESRQIDNGKKEYFRNLKEK